MLDLIGLSGQNKKFPHELSGGEQQRVALARAIANEPNILLLDEPFSSIDTEIKENLIRDIKNLLDHLSITTLMVTHDQYEAFSLADTIAVMNEGKFHQIGSPYDIYHEPLDRFVADFIGSPAINLIKGEVTDRGSIKLKSQELPHQKNNLSPNQKVVYGIRPTDVKIVDNSNVKAEVILVETTGSETHIIAMLDDNEFRIVQAGGRTSIKNGEKVSLEFDISKAHTFDQTTTKRID